MTHRIGVIGAGPAGLASALTAAEAGHEVVVFEAGDTVGGMAGSFEVAGLRVDYGSHRLHASTAPAFLDRLVELLGDDLQARERNGRIRLRDRWVGFPLRLGDMARRLPLDFGARVAMETVQGSIGGDRFAGRHDADGMSEAGSGPGFLTEVSRRLGPTVTSEFYHPYATKLYGVDPVTLSAELARRRVSASSPLSLLRKAFQARNTGGRTFYYPRRGYGQVSEALADAAVRAGAQLRMGEPVTAITAGTTPRLETAKSSIDVTAVLSTMPLPALVSSLRPPPDQTVVDAVAALRTRAMVLVYLVLERGQYTPFDAHYFPSLDISMSRLSEPRNYRSGDDPDDMTVLCAEIPCWVGDKTWHATDDDLGAQVVADLGRAGLPDPGPVEFETRRLPAVYPVYEQATDDARRIVDRWLADIPGVATFGRQGLGVPDNLHHVLDMGLAAGACLGSGGIDRDRWEASLNRFSDNVVVD